MADHDRIRAFMSTHARLLDRRRAELALGTGDPDLALSALEAYRNPGGGYGWAIEPDLRAAASQPVGALHAFEVFEEIAPATSPGAGALCDWLGAIALPGGALPFALVGADAPGTAPFWSHADPREPSLHLTTAIAGIAHRVAAHDPAVAGHPWLAAATDWCLEAIAARSEPGHALELRYALAFLDALTDRDPRARPALERVAPWLPASGVVPVAGGAEDEALRPLDFAPVPDRPLRERLDPEAVARDLDRLAAEQRDDGGWDVDWVQRTPAAGLDWRGWATVRAVRILIANGRLTVA